MWRRWLGKGSLHIVLVDLGKILLRISTFLQSFPFYKGTHASMRYLEEEKTQTHAIKMTYLLSLLQPSLLQSLKVDDLLLHFPAGFSKQVLCGRHTAPHFADTGKCWGFDELAQKVAARLASCAENECGFRCFESDVI